jgi:hypothetical protein
MKKCMTSYKKLSVTILALPLLFLPACAPWDWVKSKLGKKDQLTSVGTGDDALADEGEVLVSMNGKSIISNKSLDRDFEQLLEENPQLKSVLPLMPDAKSNFLQGMVSQAVVDRYAEENNFESNVAYQEDCKRMMRSVKRMLNTKYFDMAHPVAVADADVEKFYNDNKDMMPELVMSRGGVKAMGISFPTEAEARSFMAKAKGKDMAKVAKEMGMSAKVRDFKMVNAQSMGVDTRVKNRIAAISAVPAMEMVQGEDKAFWVVSATEKQNATYRPLEQVRAGLKQYMEKERRMAIRDTEINKLKDQYKVSVNDAYFKKQQDAQMAELEAGAMPQGAEVAQAAAPARAA